MSVELRERKWCGVLGIEKVGVEGCLIFFPIVHGLTTKCNFFRKYFFWGGRRSNLKPYIYYALFLSTELSSRGL